MTNIKLATVIYNAFDETKKNGDPDVLIGLARYRVELRNAGDDLTDDEDREVRLFIGKHYGDIVKAFKVGKPALFAAVAEMVAADEAEAEKK